MSDARRDLAAAYTRILARAGCGEPAVLAAELVTAAEGRHWRHVTALNPPPRTGPPTPAAAVPERAAAVRRQIRATTPPTGPTGGDPT